MQILSELEMQNRKRGRERETSFIPAGLNKVGGGIRVIGWGWESLHCRTLYSFMVVTHASQSIIIFRGDTIAEVRPSEAKWD